MDGDDFWLEYITRMGSDLLDVVRVVLPYCVVFIAGFVMGVML